MMSRLSLITMMSRLSLVILMSCLSLVTMMSRLSLVIMMSRLSLVIMMSRLSLVIMMSQFVFGHHDVPFVFGHHDVSFIFGHGDVLFVFNHHLHLAWRVVGHDKVTYILRSQSKFFLCPGTTSYQAVSLQPAHPREDILGSLHGYSGSVTYDRTSPFSLSTSLSV